MRIIRKRSGLVMKITVFMIIIGILITVAAVVFVNLYNNSFFAERKFEEIARDYYENTYYEDFVAEHDGENLGEAFSKYNNGITVKLRQILNTEFLNNDKNYRSYFDTESYTCDTNTSSVKYLPHEPYGKKDYNIELKLNCEKL